MKSDSDLTEGKTDLAAWFDHKNLCQLDYTVNLACAFKKQCQSLPKTNVKLIPRYRSVITPFSTIYT